MRKVKPSATGYKADPATYQFNLLRDRLRKGLKAVVTGKSSIGCQRDFRTIKFLLWDANRRGIDPLSPEWNLDHILPLHHHDFTTEKGRSAVNRPENVRWLTQRENKSRQDAPATKKEIDAHQKLVEDWKASQF
jgi:hypothetical protein